MNHFEHLKHVGSLKFHGHFMSLQWGNNGTFFLHPLPKQSMYSIYQEIKSPHCDLLLSTKNKRRQMYHYYTDGWTEKGTTWTTWWQKKKHDWRTPWIFIHSSAVPVPRAAGCTHPNPCCMQSQYLQDVEEISEGKGFWITLQGMKSKTKWQFGPSISKALRKQIASNKRKPVNKPQTSQLYVAYCPIASGYGSTWKIINHWRFLLLQPLSEQVLVKSIILVTCSSILPAPSHPQGLDLFTSFWPSDVSGCTRYPSVAPTGAPRYETAPDWKGATSMVWSLEFLSTLATTWPCIYLM